MINDGAVHVERFLVACYAASGRFLGSVGEVLIRGLWRVVDSTGRGWR